MKKPIVLLVALLLVFTAAVPVSANAPVSTSQDVDFTFDFVDCGEGHVIFDHVVATEQWTVFHNQEDNTIKITIHGQGTDNLYSLAAQDKVASGKFVFHYALDMVTGEATATGINVNITLPGYGAVYLESGMVSSDGKRVGHIVSAEALQKLCSWFFGS
jgi:hypothetical protein